MNSIIPKPNTCIKFKNSQNTIRHPIVIYADFECILKKRVPNHDEKNNTKIINDHIPMSYGYYVKHNENISKQLLDAFNIPSEPVIFRDNSQNQNVAQRFVEEIVAVGHK